MNPRPLRGLLALLLFCLSSDARAEEKEPVVVRADQVEYVDAARKVVATGHVVASYRDAKLTCDRATIYMDTKDAYLEGAVRLAQLGSLLKGDEIVYNFETRKGTVVTAEGEMGEWRTRGDRAEKIAADSYVHRSGYLTSCDFEEPHSRLRAREVRVYLGDRVVLKHAVMTVGSVPLFYLPSYTHPLDDKRARVTIIPGKDKQWGAFVLTSWRLYFHENLQGHFHADYRERLDLATGVDLNYRLPVGGEGLFREYYTHERALQREHAWSKFSKPDADRPTKERERHRFQLRHIWEPDDRTRATLEYNRASDATVIRDFFKREFGDNTAIPASYFQIIHSSTWYGLTFLINKRVNRFETVTQQLPSITLNLRPMEIPWLPAFGPTRGARGTGVLHRILADGGWFYRSSYRYEFSNVANAINGTEAALRTFDTTQELYYPFTLLRVLNLRPFGTFRQSSFSRGLKEMAPQFRQAGAAGLDLNTRFFRMFGLETDALGLDIHRLRHVVSPGLQYLYQAKPTLSANRLLRSDGLAKSNTVTPSIEQKLQTKRGAGAGQRIADLARFTTSMPYDLEGPSGRGGEWKNVGLDLEILPYRWLQVESDATIDPHIGKFATINADLVARPAGVAILQPGRRISEVMDVETGEIKDLPWAVGLGWRYQRNTSAQLTFETAFNMTEKWRLGLYQVLAVKRFAQEVSPTTTRTVKKIYNVPEYEYRLQRDLHEWTAELVYSVHRGQGEMVLLIFRLKAAPQTPFDFSRSYHRPKAGRNFPKR